MYDHSNKMKAQMQNNIKKEATDFFLKVQI